VGLGLVALQWLLIKLPAWIAPGTMAHFMAMMWGPVVGGVLILGWWLFFSRLTWTAKWIGVLSFLAGAGLAFGLGHPTMQMVFVVSSLPIATSVWVIWTAVGTRLGETALRVGLVASLLLTWGFFASLRLDGLRGNIGMDMSLRWSDTHEKKFLENLGKRTLANTMPTTRPSKLVLADGDWPAFRGAQRDGRLTGVKIRTDWAARPPKKLWEHLVGPGWSSFCVVGDYAFTQEQRGEYEVVVCYQLANGEEAWVHQDKNRFEEAMAGPGPRATPTFHEGKLYALGARGRLNCLDAASGKLIWSRDVMAESGAAVPGWGFSSSPLVAGGLVTVITGAKGKSIMAYNAATGEPAWSGGDGWSYCSPQLSRLAGVEQLLYVNDDGVVGMDPAKGQVLWQHEFKMNPGAGRVVQPTLVSGNELLLGASFGVGTRRIRVTHEGEQWQSSEVWTSRSFKPYYNDFVVHKGNVYGFDGSVLVCINLDTGKPRWRASSSYGNGQVLLLADQDMLLVLSEQGEAALVEAKAEAANEVAKFQAIEGKTWNHPVIAHGKLLVRNGERAACYALE
jgi:outer membrane protein assembly factor BamB